MDRRQPQRACRVRRDSRDLITHAQDTVNVYHADVDCTFMLLAKRFPQSPTETFLSLSFACSLLNAAETLLDRAPLEPSSHLFLGYVLWQLEDLCNGLRHLRVAQQLAGDEADELLSASMVLLNKFMTETLLEDGGCDCFLGGAAEAEPRVDTFPERQSSAFVFDDLRDIPDFSPLNMDGFVTIEMALRQRWLQLLREHGASAADRFARFAQVETNRIEGVFHVSASSLLSHRWSED